MNAVQVVNKITLEIHDQIVHQHEKKIVHQKSGTAVPMNQWRHVIKTYPWLEANQGLANHSLSLKSPVVLNLLF